MVASGIRTMSDLLMPFQLPMEELNILPFFKEFSVYLMSRNSDVLFFYS